MKMNRRVKVLLLSLVIIGTIAAHVARRVRETSFDEAAHRDTADLTVKEVTWEMAETGCIVKGVLVNHGTRLASSVILVVELRDEAGRVRATNPMVEVLDVPSRENRKFEALLPANSIPLEATVAARAVVVCWEK
ncbi:MAG: hypothetical protein KAV82_03870 [Phycisphaerae bacterium]|nr:hypothetical protein [Phycisphaerae bacterium]